MNNLVMHCCLWSGGFSYGNINPLRPPVDDLYLPTNWFISLRESRKLLPHFLNALILPEIVQYVKNWNLQASTTLFYDNSIPVLRSSFFNQSITSAW